MQHGDFLSSLVAAVIGRNSEEVSRLWEQGVRLLGNSGLIEAITLAAKFDGINRVADGIGMPLEDRKLGGNEDFLSETGIAAIAT